MPPLRRCRFALVPVLGLLMLSGCQAVGVAMGKATTIKVKPNYTGLSGQSVAVMVWASRALRIDEPALQLDVARGVQKKLIDAQKAEAIELKGTQFPPQKSPDAVFAFQRNNPGLAAVPILEVAPKLGVGRVIYIEIEDFSLSPESVPELSRGTLDARIQVIETPPRAKEGRVGFEDRISVVFPPNAPPEGKTGLNPIVTRAGVIDEATTAILKKFVTYEEGQ